MVSQQFDKRNTGKGTSLMIAELPSLLAHIEFTNHKYRIRLHVSNEDQTYAILDTYWAANYKEGQEFPSIGYCPATDSDVYELTPEQLFQVLAQRLGVTFASSRNAEHRQAKLKRPLTPAQREARRLNAAKARNRRLAKQSV
jgi:hypothetical protein